MNLLVAFDALMAERSVTRAAARMGVGQPAMSASLAKLRRLFNDPLLVRDGQTFVSTPVADSLVGPITHALGIINDSLERRRVFDPAVDTCSVTVAASDYVLLVMLSPMLSEMASAYPNVRVHVRAVTADYPDQIRRGEIDLLIMPRELERSGSAMHSQDLFTDRLVCAVDIDHPAVGNRITRAQFDALPHLTSPGGPSMSAAQRQMSAQGADPAAAVATQSFLAAPLMLRGTPFITVVYERLGRRLARQASIKLVPPPISFTPITEAMYWSPRNQDGTAHQWLRSRLLQAAAAMDRRNAGVTAALRTGED